MTYAHLPKHDHPYLMCFGFHFIFLLFWIESMILGFKIKMHSSENVIAARNSILNLHCEQRYRSWKQLCLSRNDLISLFLAFNTRYSFIHRSYKTFRQQTLQVCSFKFTDQIFEYKGTYVCRFKGVTRQIHEQVGSFVGLDLGSLMLGPIILHGKIIRYMKG